MSKTPFRMPSRDAAPATQLDQWVKGSEGAATSPANEPAKRPTGKLARLTIDLQPELHAKFKATCALKGTRMIDEIRRLIDGWIQKNG